MIPSGAFARGCVALAFFAANLLCSGADLFTKLVPGDYLWRGHDINAAGEVVGTYLTGGGIYYNGQIFTRVPDIAGRTNPVPAIYAINNRKLLVGHTFVGPETNQVRQAYVFDAKTGTSRMLGSLHGPAGESDAWGINDAGVVVGFSMTATGTMHAVRFELDGAITDLGTLGGARSWATDINEHGDIVGSSEIAEGIARAFLIPAGGRMIDLGSFGGAESRATAINDRGEIVGAAQTVDREWHAFLYRDGKLQEVGDAGSHAYDINNESVIVGTMRGANGLPQAFVRYPGGPSRELGSLVTLPAEHFLTEATAINDRGEILATEFQPSHRTGVEFTGIFRPGVLRGSVQNSEWRLKIGAPPGKSIRVERSHDLRQWDLVRTVAAETEVTHTELLGTAPHFFRAVDIATATPGNTKLR
jgi:probable HAF family extracellular repeat protein